MKAQRAKHPFENYWLYKTKQKSDGICRAVLVNVLDRKDRTTLTFARYLMSVSKGRLLSKDEIVCHIDNDNTNDSLDNLEILTASEIGEKQKLAYRQTHQVELELKCPVCEAIFMFSARHHRYQTKNGRVNFCCSLECSTKLQRSLRTTEPKK